jgi:hypothetical protein
MPCEAFKAAVETGEVTGFKDGAMWSHDGYHLVPEPTGAIVMSAPEALSCAASSVVPESPAVYRRIW